MRLSGVRLAEYGAVILSGLLFGAGFIFFPILFTCFSAAMKIPPKVLVKQDSPLQSFCFCSFPFFVVMFLFHAARIKNIA